jgi:phosphinothricin acetyltransferase
VTVRPLVDADWPAIREIYREGIESGDATFETEVPDWPTWDASRHPLVRLVAEDDSGVTGFAAISPTSKRPVYAGVAEVMVYVADRVRGLGIGTELMRALVAASEDAGIWTLQASIFPENVASIRAHERVGFRVLGRRDRIARFHDGRWRDTVVMERRSAVVGLD